MLVAILREHSRYRVRDEIPLIRRSCLPAEDDLLPIEEMAKLWIPRNATVAYTPTTAGTPSRPGPKREETIPIADYPPHPAEANPPPPGEPVISSLS